MKVREKKRGDEVKKASLTMSEDGAEKPEPIPYGEYVARRDCLAPIGRRRQWGRGEACLG